jgi:hypothetical protein
LTGNFNFGFHGPVVHAQDASPQYAVEEITPEGTAKQPYRVRPATAMNRQVHALLTLLETPQPISDEEFARRLAEAPEEEVDDETVARILAAEAEKGESISHGEMKRRLIPM